MPINTEVIKNLVTSVREPIYKLLGKKTSASQEIQSVLACDFGKTKVVLLELQKNASGVQLTQFQKFSRPTDEAQLTTLLTQTVQGFGLAKTPKVRVSVKGQGVIVRFIQFPKMNPEELRSALTYETEKYIPFKADEVAIDYHILPEEVDSKTGKMLNLILVAVKKDELYRLIQTFQKAGLEMDLIDIDAFSFYNSMEYFHPTECQSSAAILDIGTDSSTLIVAQKGSPRFIRDIAFGSADCVKRLKRKLGINDQQALEQMEVDKAPSEEAALVLKEAIKNLVSDFRVSLDYYMDQVASAEPVKKVFLGGGIGYSPLVLNTFAEDLGIPVQGMDIISKLSMASSVDKEVIQKNQAILPVALGLALREA